MTRLLPAALALATGAGAAWLGLNHPLSPSLMLAAATLMAGLTAWRFAWWPMWLLPCLPLASLAPWSGWLVAEEWDALLLACCAGGYARMAFEPAPRDAPTPALRPWLVLGSFAVLTLVAMHRGFQDAGGLQLGWWQGYREPLNALRLAKPVLEVLLLLPLWQALLRRRGAAAAGWVMVDALVLAAAAIAVPVWWERLAFTGLTNFSTDYRATGWFWEMHVGGAGLDAGLALVAPFLFAALRQSGTAARATVAAVALTLTTYAALVTFSRIVYVALPVALVAWWGLSRLGPQPGGERSSPWAALWIVLSAVVLAAWVFPFAGHRGVLALGLALGAIVVLRNEGVEATRRAPVIVALAAVAGVVALAALARVLDKGAYIGTGLLACVAIGGGLSARRRPSTTVAAVAWGCALAGAPGMTAVAWHWGGAGAAPAVAWGSIALMAFALWSAAGPQALRPSWPGSWRWQLPVLMTVAAALGAVGVFMGGSYMSERLTTTNQDARDRQGHWRLLLGLLQDTEQQLLGHGLGRTPAQLAMSGHKDLQTGDYRLVPSDNGQGLVLTAGAHVQGWGEMLRVSQRLTGLPSGPLTLRLRLRPAAPLSLHAEVCEKHLLYNAGCVGQTQTIKSDPGQWRVLQWPMPGEALSGGPWYAPRSLVFALALDSEGARAEIDDVSLMDAQGREWLANGDFERGLARWFFSSDRHHMPWHAKNLWVHLWFEQGLLAVGVLTLGFLLAWVRAVQVARTGTQPLAAATAAALAALCVVGLVDSGFDMPRITFLTLWVMALALSLKPASPRAPSGGRAYT